MMHHGKNGFRFYVALATSAEKIAKEIVFESKTAERNGLLRDAATIALDAAEAFREAARLSRLASSCAPNDDEANRHTQYARDFDQAVERELKVMIELLEWAVPGAHPLPGDRTDYIRGFCPEAA